MLLARRRAQVAAQRGLPADLEVGHAARARAERLDRVLELGERRARADRRAAVLAADAAEARLADQQRARGAEAAVRDLRHHDRPAGHDRDTVAVAERLDRLLAR